MIEKILIAYKQQFFRDILLIRDMGYMYTDEEGKGFHDGFNKRSVLGIILEIFILLPGKLAFGGPFLVVAYFGNLFIRYLFLPLLVLTENIGFIHKVVFFVEKFLKSFFGLFGILETLPNHLRKSKDNGSYKLDYFNGGANNFQKNGPQMVDKYFARKRYNIWSGYDSYIKGPLYLFNRKWPLRRIIKRKSFTLGIILKYYLFNIPINLQYRKKLGKYRIKVLTIYYRPSKTHIKIATTRIAHYIYLGLRIFFLILQGVLLNIEIIFVPERLSLGIRRRYKELKNKIILFLIKKGYKKAK